MKKLILSAALCGLIVPTLVIAKDAKTNKIAEDTTGKSCCSMLSRSAMLKAGAKKVSQSAVYAVSKMTCDGCAKGLQASLGKKKASATCR